jgi:RNA polymerase sigma factor (TIGR02999 family)
MRFKTWGPGAHNSPVSAEVPLTDLIRKAQGGDEAALKGIFDAAYADLRILARARLSRGGRGVLLDTTALVHESYLRFANNGQLRLEDRQHFLRYAGHVMRSVIVDFARENLAKRRGSGARHVTLNSEVGNVRDGGEAEILNVHEALEELGQRDPRMVQVVEMKYFAGMTESEVAEALGVTDRTVRRDWEKARLLLAQLLA